MLIAHLLHDVTHLSSIKHYTLYIVVPVRPLGLEQSQKIMTTQKPYHEFICTMYITRIENVIQEISIPSVGQSAGNSKVRKGGLHIHRQISRE